MKNIFNLLRNCSLLRNTNLIKSQLIRNNHSVKRETVVLLAAPNQSKRSFFQSSVKMSEVNNHSEVSVAEIDNSDAGSSNLQVKDRVLKRHANTQHGDKSTADEENIVVSFIIELTGVNKDFH